MKDNPKKKSLFKKLMLAIIPLGVIAVVLAVVLPLTLNTNKDVINVKNPSLIEGKIDQEKINKLAFESLTGAKAINNVDNVTYYISKQAFLETEKDEIKSVLPTVDMILTNKSSFTTTLIDSTNKDFDYELTVSYLSTSEMKVESTLYFDIVLEKEEVENNEYEKTVLYKGIYKFNNKEYEFLATLEEEKERDEVESEMTFTLFKNASKTSFITVTESKESENREYEETFQYEIFEDGYLRKAFEISTEIKANKQEIELELNDKEYIVDVLNKDGVELFKFTRESNRNDVLVYEKNKSVDSTTGEVSVSYLETSL